MQSNKFKQSMKKKARYVTAWKIDFLMRLGVKYEFDIPFLFVP
jgi:hypothetical protein